MSLEVPEKVGLGPERVAGNKGRWWRRWADT